MAVAITCILVLLHCNYSSTVTVYVGLGFNCLHARNTHTHTPSSVRTFAMYLTQSESTNLLS